MAATKESALTTSGLLRRLFKTTSFDRFLEENGESVSLPPFHAYLSALCEERGEVRERVIKRADIERTYGHQLFRGIRTPSRDKTVQLAFGFGLTVDETQELLKAAQKRQLYPKLKRDAALIYGLSHHLTVTEVQALLEQLGLTLLGGAAGD